MNVMGWFLLPFITEYNRIDRLLYNNNTLYLILFVFMFSVHTPQIHIRW